MRLRRPSAARCPTIENITEAVTELGDGIANLDFGTILSGLWDIVTGPDREQPHRRMARRGQDHRAVDASGSVAEGSSTSWARFGDTQQAAADQADALTAAQEKAPRPSPTRSRRSATS